MRKHDLVKLKETISKGKYIYTVFVSVKIPKDMKQSGGGKANMTKMMCKIEKKKKKSPPNMLCHGT